MSAPFLAGHQRFAVGTAVYPVKWVSADSGTGFSGGVPDAVSDSGGADKRVWSDNSGDGSRNGTWIIGDQYGILCTGE